LRGRWSGERGARSSSGGLGGLFLIACALAALALAVAGCGGEDEGHEAADPAAERRVETTGGGRTQRGSPANPPPKGSSPFARELYRQFPPPEADPQVKGSEAAIEAGERACAGKTPLEVKETYFQIAVERGRIDPESPEGRTIEEIERFEARVTEEPSFAAGQLATAAYRETRPARLANFAGRGCIYALAKALERRVSSED
jgi:hypothetical protein